MLELLWAGRGDSTRDRSGGYKRPDVPARRGALAGGGAEAIQRIIASVSRRQSVTSQPDTQVRFIKQVYVWLDRMTRCPCQEFQQCST